MKKSSIVFIEQKTDGMMSQSCLHTLIDILSQGRGHSLVVGSWTCYPEAPSKNPPPCHYVLD